MLRWSGLVLALSLTACGDRDRVPAGADGSSLSSFHVGAFQPKAGSAAWASMKIDIRKAGDASLVHSATLKPQDFAPNADGSPRDNVKISLKYDKYVFMLEYRSQDSKLVYESCDKAEVRDIHSPTYETRLKICAAAGQVAGETPLAPTSNVILDPVGPGTTPPTPIVPDPEPVVTGDLAKLLTPAMWKDMFPTVAGVPVNAGTWVFDKPSFGASIFTHDNFLKAAATFPEFASQGSRHDRIRELAAFLGNIAHETTGGWGGFEPGSLRYKLGLYFKEEQGCEGGTCAGYCVASAEHACVAGKTYHGRGPIQLSYNYNYGLMSERLGLKSASGKLDLLLQQPELLTSDGVLSFRSALWFWMTAQGPKPAAHDVMTLAWTPSSADAAGGRTNGFGMTINIINGGLECSKPTHDKVKDRIGFYLSFLAAIGGTNADGSLKVSPAPGGSQADGSYPMGSAESPSAAMRLACDSMQHY